MLMPLLLSLLSAVPSSSPADTLTSCGTRDTVVYGRIWTGEVDAPVFAEALLLRSGRVVAVGPARGVERLASHGYCRVSLGERVVLPGLIDGHSHVAQLVRPEWVVGADPNTWAPGPGPSATEVQQLVAERAAHVPPGTPIVVFYGAGLYASLNAQGVTARALLDAATTAHPVYGLEWSGHAQAINSAALDEAGLRDYQPNPYGGWLGRDELGRLTGVLQEFAVLPAVEQLSRRISDAEYVAQYDYYDQGGLAYGTTLTSDVRFVFGEERAERIRRALPRPNAFQPVCIITSAGQQCAPGPDGEVRRKVFSDGTHVACSAHVSVPYLAPETCPAGFGGDVGLRNLTDVQLDWALEDTLARGGQLLVHAIGDAGIEQTLSRLEARPDVDWRGKVSIEHFDMAQPGQVKRTKALGVTVVQNPTHLVLIGAMMRERNASELYEHAQPLRILVEQGIPLALASDAFGPAAPNPWLGLYLATLSPYRPSEALTRAQVLGAYTREAAKARLLPYLGTLTRGKSATFFVANADPFAVPAEALPSLKSCLTVVEGRPLWSDSTCFE
ncbi:amidohydrolase [Pyxidicoccus caerfyrddinensis]|uniref:amidohydrolase n=1 Tax=Pyxidicoccus caerfyrddinensis TaxID=2709663 RepID=UPI0013D987C3|nr:amidohydrolase family protein [Pyxidicoccus caerfyrddinensis]